MLKKQKEEKLKILEETLKDLKDKFGEGSIMTLKESRKIKVDSISTGSFSLDMALGVGGVPRGRIIEIFGPESSGKTTLALHIIAQAQKEGGFAAFIDAEHALDPEYAQKIGVDIKNLLISQPDTGEQALQITEDLVKSNVVDVIVIDSVAALVPKIEIEGEMGDQHVGLQARLMSQALRKLTAIAAKSKTVIIFINQLRMKIGVMFGNPETTPGGQALKFYSSVRIDIRKVGQIKKGEEIIGSRVKAKVVKNKVAPPFKSAEFDIIYNEGISYEADVINTALKFGVVKKSGSFFSYGKQKLGQGLDASRIYLKNNPEVTKQIIQEIKDKMKEEIEENI